MTHQEKSRHRAPGPAKTHPAFGFFARKAPRRAASNDHDLSRRAVLITPAAGLALAATAYLTNALVGGQAPVDDAVTMSLDLGPQPQSTTSPVSPEWDYLINPDKARAAIPTPTATQTVEKTVHKKLAAQPPTVSAKPKLIPKTKSLVRPQVLTASTPNRKIRQGIIDTAHLYFGVPYLWGGTNPDVGLDCSAYTRLVYGAHGLTLPRVSRDQYRAMVPVSDPIPGDLVFLGSPIHHVGIYVRPGVMLDAPNRGSYVGESDIWDRNARYARHPKLM